MLWFHNVYSSGWQTLNQAFFGGIDGDDGGLYHRQYCALAAVLPVLLLCSAFIGGMAGSTGGGLKVIRILLCKQGSRELKRLVHPNAVYTIKLGNRALPERILEAGGAFLGLRAGVSGQHAGDYRHRRG